MNYKFEDLIPEIRNHLDYLGLDLVEIDKYFSPEIFDYEVGLYFKQRRLYSVQRIFNKTVRNARLRDK